MSRTRKAKRSILKALLLWVGRRMLGRVQKRSLRSITRRPKPKRFALPVPPRFSKRALAVAKRPGRARRVRSQQAVVSS